jgi:chloramphenicol O-acetyltransferase type A
LIWIVGYLIDKLFKRDYMRKKIDMAKYARKSTFEAFLHHEVPVLSTTCEVDITALYEFRKKYSLRFFPLLAFLIDKTVNEVEAMRHRIIEGELYEYNVIHPSFTTLLPNNTISFCDAMHTNDEKIFYEQIVSVSEDRVQTPNLEIIEKHDRYFISNIPWIRFSSFTHPYLSQYSSIPIITTGKFQQSGIRITMPIALQVHHSLIDGYHLGEFYSILEQNIKNAPELLSATL